MDDSEDAIESEYLFEATTDAMAIVDVSDGEWAIRAVNSAFERVFNCRESNVHDRRLAIVVGLANADQFQSAVETGVETESTVDLDGRDGDSFIRVRPFETDPSTRVEPSTRAVVMIADSTPSNPRTASTWWDETWRGGIQPVVRMARADDVSAVCEGAAELLLDVLDFDALVVDIDGVETYLTGVDAPIQLPRTREDSREVVRHDVMDANNETRWERIVQHDVSDHGIVQVAVREETSSPHDPEAIELFTQYLDGVLDRLEREQSLRAEREEVTLFNRVLRHDVLNGLNLIQARLELLEEDVSRANREHYETVDARIGDMLDRVESVRKIRRDDYDSTKLDAYPLREIVRARIDGAAEGYPEASFSIVGSIPKVEVVVDDLVHFCLQNVLRNSVQHADIDTPEVRVEVKQTGGFAVIRIADNGPGLPEEPDQSVFEQGVSNLEGDGHGEGLFLTRKVIETVYDGRIRADESDRGGAEFVVELPLAED